VTGDQDVDFIRRLAREAEDHDSQVQDAIRQAEHLAESYRRSIPGLRGARHLAARMDAGMAELVAQTVQVVRAMSVTQVLRAHGTPDAQQAGFQVVEAAEIIGRAESDQAIALAQEIAADPENAEALEKVSRTIHRAGLAGLSPGLLLIIVLIFLVAAGLPVALPELPAGAQTVVMGELASVSLALAIVGRLIDKHRQD
jgi:hypothetical protein